MPMVKKQAVAEQFNAMVTNHLRVPYGVYFTKYRTILRRMYGARLAAGRIVRFLIGRTPPVRYVTTQENFF